MIPIRPVLLALLLTGSIFCFAAEKTQTYSPVPSLVVEVLSPGRNRVTFSFVSPSAEKVYLAGEFNGWDATKQEMKKAPGNTFTAKVDLPDGVHPYKFVVNGRDWVADPVNPDTADDNNGGRNSIVRLGPAYTIAARAAPSAATPVPAPVPIPWTSDPAAAVRQAASSGKRVFVLFAHPGAKQSQLVESMIQNDGALSRAVAGDFVPVRVDVTRQQELVKQLQVFRGGVVVIYKPDGTAEKKIELFTTPEQLLKEIGK